MTDSIARLFMVKEAVNSVAIEHGECECLTCRAAAGDDEAFGKVLTEVNRSLNTDTKGGEGDDPER